MNSFKIVVLVRESDRIGRVVSNLKLCGLCNLLNILSPKYVDIILFRALFYVCFVKSV